MKGHACVEGTAPTAGSEVVEAVLRLDLDEADQVLSLPDDELRLDGTPLEVEDEGAEFPVIDADAESVALIPGGDLVKSLGSTVGGAAHYWTVVVRPMVILRFLNGPAVAHTVDSQTRTSPATRLSGVRLTFLVLSR